MISLLQRTYFYDHVEFCLTNSFFHRKVFRPWSLVRISSHPILDGKWCHSHGRINFSTLFYLVHYWKEIKYRLLNGVNQKKRKTYEKYFDHKLWFSMFSIFAVKLCHYVTWEINEITIKRPSLKKKKKKTTPEPFFLCCCKYLYNWLLNLFSVLLCHNKNNLLNRRLFFVYTAAFSQIMMIFIVCSTYWLKRIVDFAI